ncbi:MAG: chemotaxis protein CheW, partial [Candidatus Cloacimonetes bacterium]|nr:chemotaxis protein CheW [Candidatus Cloacimonadota bacterium]
MENLGNASEQKLNISGKFLTFLLDREEYGIEVLRIK